MKKLFLMMALVATALFTVTACGDDDDDNGGSGSETGGTVTLKEPPYKKEAKVVNIDGDVELGIKQIRVMESGAYAIAIDPTINARETRSVDLTSYFFEFGTYTISNGVFNFSNGMKIVFDTTDEKNYDITITWKGGTTIKTTGTLDTSNAVPTGVMTDNLCTGGPWKIQTLRAVGNYNGIKPVKEFTGPINLYDIKEWYEKNFGTLHDKFDAETVIKGIYFDMHGLFAINYTNRDPDVGVWRWTDMNAGKLVYSWNKPATAISLFTGDASVSFSKSPDTCKLTLKGNVNGADLEFVFTMVPDRD